MADGVSFETVLAYLSEHGWAFDGFYRRAYRVFVKEGRPPLAFKVDDGKVARSDVEEIKERVERDYA